MVVRNLEIAANAADLAAQPRAQKQRQAYRPPVVAPWEHDSAGDEWLEETVGQRGLSIINMIAVSLMIVGATLAYLSL
jgi:hypothetical protein